MGDSQVSALELIVGARDKRDLADIDAFLSAYAVVPLRESTGTRAYELLKGYAKSNGLHVFDSLVAATAIEENITLVTRNRRHFGVVEGLRLGDPRVLRDPCCSEIAQRGGGSQAVM